MTLDPPSDGVLAFAFALCQAAPILLYEPSLSMPYALIATLAALASTGWFVIAARASLTAKVLVSILCAASLAIGLLWRQWWLAGLLVQALIVIGIRLYAMASRNRPTASAPNE